MVGEKRQEGSHASEELHLRGEDSPVGYVISGIHEVTQTTLASTRTNTQCGVKECCGKQQEASSAGALGGRFVEV